MGWSRRSHLQLLHHLEKLAKNLIGQLLPSASLSLFDLYYFARCTSAQIQGISHWKIFYGHIVVTHVLEHPSFTLNQLLSPTLIPKSRFFVLLFWQLLLHTDWLSLPRSRWNDNCFTDNSQYNRADAAFYVPTYCNATNIFLRLPVSCWENRIISIWCMQAIMKEPKPGSLTRE